MLCTHQNLITAMKQKQKLLVFMNTKHPLKYLKV